MDGELTKVLNALTKNSVIRQDWVSMDSQDLKGTGGEEEPAMQA